MPMTDNLEFTYTACPQSLLYWNKSTGELFYKHFAEEPVVIGTIVNSDGWKLLVRHLEQIEGFYYGQGVEHGMFDMQETIAKCLS